MARTYRLPVSLGGGECEIVQDRVDGYPGYVSVRLTAHTMNIPYIVPRQDLDEVSPPLPEEPPVGAYLIGGRLAVRFGGQYGSSWLYAMPGGGYGETPSWDDAWRSLSDGDDSPDIVLLVPDPAAGVEPNGEWKCTEAERDRFAVRAGNYGSGSVVEVAVRGGTEMVFLSRDDAEAAGRTLLAAARSARVGA